MRSLRHTAIDSVAIAGYFIYVRASPARAIVIVMNACMLLFVGCRRDTETQVDIVAKTLFTLLPTEHTHIDFSNQLTEGLNTNILAYEYFYNGGGVAIGDVNSDGLDDLYFSGNMTQNKLYINKGNLQFEDVTTAAGVEGRDGSWKTGVSMVDINGDGLLDIFLCYSGKVNGVKRIKQLFVNTGNNEAGLPKFSEEAERYGLADSSFTTQAVFFDYDQDDDLDALFVNHNPHRIDNLDDNFVARLQEQPHPTIGVKLLQNSSGKFTEVTEIAGLKSTALSYGLAASVSDLYVASGGYHQFAPNDVLLQDRLYINDGKGNFRRDTEALPTMKTSAGCVRATDINNDGHADLFVGGRVVPGRYPETPNSYILLNNGRGHFKDMTAFVAPAMGNIGMVTDAAWIDLNNDHRDDLILVGEWMPVTLFINVGGKLVDKTKHYLNKPYTGWWNKLLIRDFNHDHKPDLIVGNLGLNSQAKASDSEPAELYYNDFDHNGSVDPVFCFYVQGKSYPYISRDEMLEQLGMLRKRFPTYARYADATMNEIFTDAEREGMRHLEANTLTTTYFESDAEGKFQAKPLPLPTQYAPVYTLTALDYDDDGNDDVLLCGNITHARLRFGKYDANYGVLLKGDGRGDFRYIPQPQSGFRLRGDVRSVIDINSMLLFGINQQPVSAYRKRRHVQ